MKTRNVGLKYNTMKSRSFHFSKWAKMNVWNQNRVTLRFSFKLIQFTTQTSCWNGERWGTCSSGIIEQLTERAFSVERVFIISRYVFPTEPKQYFSRFLALQLRLSETLPSGPNTLPRASQTHHTPDQSILSHSPLAAIIYRHYELDEPVCFSLWQPGQNLFIFFWSLFVVSPQDETAASHT